MERDVGLGLKRFSGEGDTAKEYPKWKKWCMAMMLSRGDKLGKEARGAFLFTLLEGKAAEAVEHVTFSEIAADSGEALLWELLDRRFPTVDKHDELGEALDAVFSLTAAEGAVPYTQLTLPTISRLDIPGVLY